METNNPTNACNLTPRQPGLQHRCQNWPKKVPDPDRGGQCWLLLLPPGDPRGVRHLRFFFRRSLLRQGSSSASGCLWLPGCQNWSKKESVCCPPGFARLVVGWSRGCQVWPKKGARFTPSGVLVAVKRGLFLLLPTRSTKKMSELTEEGSWDHTLRGAWSLDVCSARVMCFKQWRRVSELAGPRLLGCWSLRV